MIEIDLEQGTDAWHQFRLSHIGASDAPIIMGISPYKTSYLLWMEKLGLYKQEQTEAMARGHELEPIARKALESKLGRSFTPCVIQHESIPWLAASLDGLTDDKNAFCEIKCSTRYNHLLLQGGEAPDHWIIQVQHQLMVTGCQYAYLCSYYDGYISYLKIMPDYDMREKILEKEKEFWNYVQTFTEPPLTDRDIIQRDDIEWLRTASEYTDIQKKIRQMELQEIELKQKLMELSNGMNCKGGGIKLLKIARKGNVDYSAIPGIKEMDLELYRKPASSYVKISRLQNVTD
jgi:putative phage-type endonuclease